MNGKKALRKYDGVNYLIFRWKNGWAEYKAKDGNIYTVNTHQPLGILMCGWKKEGDDIRFYFSGSACSPSDNWNKKMALKHSYRRLFYEDDRQVGYLTEDAEGADPLVILFDIGVDNSANIPEKVLDKREMQWESIDIEELNRKYQGMLAFIKEQVYGKEQA